MTTSPPPTATPSRDDDGATASTSTRVVPSVALEWAAAGVGCALADTMFNPLEVLKVRAQQSASRASATSLAREAIRRDGFVRGLVVPGLTATWMRGLSYTGFRVGLYPSARDAAAAATGGNGFETKLFAGALTGGVGAFVFNPIDVVRVRMQSSEVAYRSTLSAFGEVARAEGAAAGLWRGAGVCVTRAMTLSGSQLATYDASKRWFLANGYFDEDAPPLHFTSSFVSGVAAQTVTQPVDTLKTLVMSQTTTTNAERRGAITIARDIIATHGARGLYRGFFAAAARQGPVMVIQMPLVEALRKCLGLEYF